MSRVWLIAGLAAVLQAAHAFAADQPILAPPAAWVEANEAPQPFPPVTAAATRVLLFDMQLHFGQEGISVYGHSQIRLQTAAGLAGGNFTVPWNPDLGSLTVHTLRILRDGQVVDVLEKQKFSVLRRETNLEMSTLDGVLTAELQPEDLRVGDVIEAAFTITLKDPALAGHAQSLLAIPNWAIDDVRVRATSSLAKPFRWRITDSLADARAPEAGEGRQVRFRLAGVEPVLPPDGAPPRFLHGRELELSDFASWSEVSALMAPLYVRAAVIPPSSSLNAEIVRIKSLSSDPKIQAQAALELVQAKVRYVALTMNDGGVIPADAEATWTRRFGDCKGKTALLLALLKTLGIDAQPALVSVAGGDGLEARLPGANAFDHVLVRATIAGKVYWLDGARMSDHALDAIQVPPFHWALPLQSAGATLVPLAPIPLEQPATATTIRLDASAGLDQPAPAHLEAILRGDEAVATNAALSNVGAALDTVLTQYWKKTYDFIEPRTVSASFDDKTNEEHLVMDGMATMAWTQVDNGAGRQYEVDGYGLGWKANFHRSPGPHADAPYAVPFPAFEQTTETILLPNEGKGFTIEGAEVNLKAAGRAFRRTLRVAGNQFIMTASTQSLSYEFPSEQADAAAKALTDLAGGSVYLRAPATYQRTKQEVDATLAATPASLRGYLDRGLLFLHQGRLKEAIADFTKATLLDPKSAVASADLGIAEAHLGEEKAAADLDKALALDPKEYAVYEGRGILAERGGKLEDAIAAYGKALELDPDDAFARNERARLEVEMGRTDAALADTDALLKGNAQKAPTRLLRIQIFVLTDRLDLAMKEADAAVADDPDSPEGYLYRAQILAKQGKSAEAQAQFSRSLTLHPTVAAYLARARYRAAKLADINAALALGDNTNSTLLTRADAEAEAGSFDKAIADADLVVGKDPTNPDARLERAKILVEAGRPRLAEADFNWARAQAGRYVGRWNNLCWTEATANSSLDQALKDCETGIGFAPKQAAILDSRAFVLLRLGRTAEAIAGYGDALALRPRQAASLYGRGVAELRAHDESHGRADLAAARGIDPQIDGTFAGYGIKP